MGINPYPRYCLLKWNSKRYTWECVHFGTQMEDIERQIKKHSNTEIFIHLGEMKSDENRRKNKAILESLIQTKKKEKK